MSPLKPEIKEEWHATVPAKSFWIAVLAVAIPLCVLGFYNIETGDVPEVPSEFHVSSLVFLAVVVLYQLSKYGRRAFPFSRVMNILGLTLFFSSLLMAPGAPG
ncbi:MAG: hypothetical protein H8F28_02630, partial [Fibrella sp.]|nr:hypothetical protein [Armatimonadota bacterium]